MTAQARTRGAWHTCDTATVAWLLATLALAAVTLVAFTHLRQLEPVATPWPYDSDFARIADGTAPDRAAVEIGGRLAGRGRSGPASPSLAVLCGCATTTPRVG